MIKKYKISYSKKFKKSIRKIDEITQRRIEAKIKFIISQPNPLLYAIKLKGLGDLYRFRIGDYRVIFELDKNDQIVVLMILDIKHRKEAYDKL